MFEKFGTGFWSESFLGNTNQDYAVALIVFAAFLLIFKLFQGFVLRRLRKIAQKTETDIDDTLINAVQTLKPPFYSFVAFYLALNFLTVSGLVQKAVNIVLVIWVIYQVVIALQVLVDYIVRKQISKHKDKGTQTAVGVLGKTTKVLLWAGGLLFMLSNLGINITSLIAGLGIGGIAIAFALQNILNDLFSSFAIYFDKPFVVGDFIKIGEHAGTVEKVGIKTTRIRSTTGEELIVSNRELTTTRVQNFKRLSERRSIFTIGVVYETPAEKLRKIPSIIQTIIESQSLTRFDRVHFKTFGDFSLNFDVSYYVQTTDYKKFMDTQEIVNLEIVEAFEKEGISMAYPTQTIYLEKT